MCLPSGPSPGGKRAGLTIFEINAMGGGGSARDLPRLVAAGLAITWRAGRRALIVMALLELLSGIGVAAEAVVGRRLLESVLTAQHTTAGLAEVWPSAAALELRDDRVRDHRHPVARRLRPSGIVLGWRGRRRARHARPAARVRRAERRDAPGVGDVPRRLPRVRRARRHSPASRGGRPGGADGTAAAVRPDHRGSGKTTLAKLLGPAFINGTDLSQGQWQRLALARTFFRDAPLVILDEPTAALDAKAEHELFARIHELLAGRSVLLISHRFSTVRSADRIYVLSGGRVEESGTHDELIAADGIYAELFSLQALPYQ
ncbi:MAG TPA: ATP-binding cassette domain-containing protein [Trebonia sp.]|nr:ATP-binding cassette domain-containing protein [Trebonia sp.]